VSYDVKDFIKKATGLHAAIANDVCKDDIYRLHCRTCGDIGAISAREFAHYLAHGWPKCCGQTKMLEKE
jgi:hypothetical protein